MRNILKEIRAGRALAACCLAACISSCVYIDDNVGQNFIPTDQLYDVHTISFPLTDIKMEYSDSLSGFSSSRITVGAVRDPETGLSKRASAFTLVPLEEEMDFGENPEIIRFHFTAVRDTLSYPDESQEKILQNIYAYEITKDLGSKYIYTSSGYRMREDGVIGSSPISPLIVYSGQDSLSFDFSKSFGQDYIDRLAEKYADIDSIGKYNEEFPGICLMAEDPVGNGGRINMFELVMQVSDSYVVSGNYAELQFMSTYEGERKDTSFLFYFGAQSLTYSSSGQQYALNLCYHDSYDPSNPDNNVIISGESIRVEGGGGLKPVISAKEIRDSVVASFTANGVDMNSVVINKASLIFPFDDPDYNLKDIYPTMLSPTCRLNSEVSSDDAEGGTTHSVYYAGLTDASVSSENQGDVNWSLSQYAPDITHHVQEVIKLDDEADFRTRDIWLLILATETVTETSDNSDLNEYYQNLLYNSYYNNLYGYGNYGYGYGYGYGGYYDYSNYYNYYMMAAMMSNSSNQTTSSSPQLDKDRYYTCILRGPDAPAPAGADANDLKARRVPMVEVTYSVPRSL